MRCVALAFAVLHRQAHVRRLPQPRGERLQAEALRLPHSDRVSDARSPFTVCSSTDSISRGKFTFLSTTEPLSLLRRLASARSSKGVSIAPLSLRSSSLSNFAQLLNGVTGEESLVLDRKINFPRLIPVRDFLAPDCGCSLCSKTPRRSRVTSTSAWFTVSAALTLTCPGVFVIEVTKSSVSMKATVTVGDFRELRV